ncbi:MAG: hypothetical protein GF375_03380 [Candidatus Omnitrophica bacterium]|nr:hypothetical protein [Candidatus Omnitrophota bacterium]MBD3269117.1 hypothetical protein [Candidatus Omnitrophota bacterium]
MAEGRCAICGKKIKVKEDTSGKDFFCIKCAGDYGDWSKFMAGSSQKGFSAKDIKNSTPLGVPFLLRLFIFAVLSSLLFVFSLIPLKEFSFLGWVVAAIISLLVLLPLVFRGMNPLAFRRARVFFWPFIVGVFLLGMFVADILKPAYPPGLISMPLAFILGLIWLLIRDKRLKEESLLSFKYYENKNKEQ